MPKSVLIYTDGGCLQNPGPAAIGVVLKDASSANLDTISKFIGEGTNNQAEYRAIIAGLERARELKAEKVEIRSDSLLVVQQMRGRFRVKDAGLMPLFQKAQELSRRFPDFSISHIPRELNREADRLACQALEARPAAQAPSDIVIRRASMKDIEGMNRVWAEVEELHAEGLPSIFRRVANATRDRRYVASILSDSNSVIFVAVREKNIIGLIQVMLQMAPDLPYMIPRRYAKVSDLVVARPYQQNGVGSALMAEAEKWAKAKRASSMELNVYEFNNSARSFYRRHGFETASRMMWKNL